MADFTGSQIFGWEWRCLWVSNFGVFLHIVQISNFHYDLIRQFLHLIRREIGSQRLTENERIFTNDCFENVETHAVPYSPRRSGETIVNMLLI